MKASEVLTHYFPSVEMAIVEPFGDGLVNETYRVRVPSPIGEQSYILQRMNPAFSPLLMEDIDAVSSHLLSKGVGVPQVVRSLNGSLYVQDGKNWWRMLTFVPGTTHVVAAEQSHIYEAGRLAGQAHAALSDFSRVFLHVLPGFHDTDGVMSKLDIMLKREAASSKYKVLGPLGLAILSALESLPRVAGVPIRVIHGDLKLANIRFDESGSRAIALLDLDTFMRAPVAIELGDALRSWCANKNEDDASISFNLDLYKAALEGYASFASFMEWEEWRSIPVGIAQITLELAARYIIDAFEESYFRYDSSKYASLFEHNLARARAQHLLYLDLWAKRDKLFSLLPIPG